MSVISHQIYWWTFRYGSRRTHRQQSNDKKYLIAKPSIRSAFVSPFNAWLLLRGLRTLPIRLKHISESTHLVIDFLKIILKSKKVYFPLDPDSPQYELAKKQMTELVAYLPLL
ncbi:MAG: PLP-dependent transferase [Spirosomataceae bacterium]